MQKMLDLLEEQSLEKDAETLQKFYQSVKTRASGIDNAEGKQRIIVELYDKFFKTAFPKMVEKLGIVYTPVEVVDFIIHSVNDILKKEFNRTISDENIHVLDPFTGTGTFISRLLQSGLIAKEDAERKYLKEIHANEIVLLAYYIAAVNIENSYHDLLALSKEEKNEEVIYKSFEGICLTDTFQLGESQDGEKLFSDMFPQNSKRVQRQQKAPLRIIMGNPPYSIGQKSANDNAQNQSYPKLDARIADTYAKLSSAGLNKSLYDAYIKAFRWGTDRLDQTGGIISFVSNGAWLDGNSTDGFRKTIEKEFTAIYVFNLRGNARTSGELRQKEAGNVFGGGSRTPIAITLLVKKPETTSLLKERTDSNKATIYYYDIGNYLDKDEKLKIVNDFKSFADKRMPLKKLEPNEHGDWISVRNDNFQTFIPLHPEKKFDLTTKTFFNTYAIGVSTNRDAWVVNFSPKKIRHQMNLMVQYYNTQREAFIKAKRDNAKLEVQDFVDATTNKISWTRALRRDAKNNVAHTFKMDATVESLYRPFNKQFLYFDKPFIESPGLSSKFFPKPNLQNIAISITGEGNLGFSVLIGNRVIDLCYTKTGNGGGQTFPLYYYDEAKSTQQGLFDKNNEHEFVRRDAISDYIFDLARKQYGRNITKEDIFYYVYGFLHLKKYQEIFANDLKKMLPRLPLLEEVRDFWKFSNAGRQLAELHLNYETQAVLPEVIVTGAADGNYTVDKIRFPTKTQKDTIIYNNRITISNIPERAYEYVVGGKSAIEWVIERYQVTTHKESGIMNNPNDWATETNNPRYILDLLLSVISVSVQTVDLVNSLPDVKF